MATVPRRTGDGWPVRRPVAMVVPGFGGSGLYGGHTPSYCRHVGTVLVGAVLVGFWELAFFAAGSWELALGIAGRGKTALCFVCLKARMAR